MADKVENVNSKGRPKKEYPKLVKTENGKVLCQSAKEEKALNLPENKDKKW